MSKPHYVTKRVGEEYVLVRVDPVGNLGRVVAGGLGFSLLSRGVRRGGLFSALSGGALLYHAFTGQDPLKLICNKQQARHGSDKDSPSFPGESVSQQLPTDALEEASMESFPASDPPASMHSTKHRA